MTARLRLAITLGLLWSATAVAQTPPTPPAGPLVPGQALTLAPIDVIAPTPLPGTGIERDKVPANVQVLPSPDLAKQGPSPLTSLLDQRLSSVNINDNEDNLYHPDIQYRGFTVSPVLGTPTGLAVYQNGVRLNEPFGDNVSWDLVPDFAIDRLAVIPTNPVYGLNALGGALVLNMKNGFTYQGGELQLEGGSFGHVQGTLQYGKQVGNVAAYLGLNAAWDDGYRKLSPARVKQMYADIGAESDKGSLHFSFTGADNLIAGIGPTPIQLVDVDRTAVFVSPQYFHDTVLMPTLTANYIANDQLSFQGNFYLRSSGRGTNAGNISDIVVCGRRIPDTLCLDERDNPLFSTTGGTVPNILGGAPPAENDYTQTTSLGLGGSVQGTYTAPIFDHANNLVVGFSIDHGDVDFNSSNEVASITLPSLVTKGTGIIVAQPDGSLDPVALETTNSYYGLYASDTFNVTPELAVTLGGRYNVALIHLFDKIGTALNGNNRFSRFNPAAGATYKITPDLTAYFGYAEANRTPTAGEIGCSDPTRPCTLDAFLSADPPGLQQVVARNYEAGLRGKFDVDLIAPNGKAEWQLGFFRNDLENDILAVPSAIISTGYFTNIGDTRRQGIEAGIAYRDEKWRFSANYSYIDATFQSPITLASPDNPFADADGNIQVRPGDQIPGVPQHRVKLTVDYSITDKWTVGGDLLYVGDQYYFNDQSNQNPQLPGYIVANLRSSYQVTDNIQFFALIKNLFDNDYATYGIFNDPTKSPLPGVANPSDPRFVSVAPPISVYGGIKITF
ncbi:MAG TPA: TonB-dependent receptor [Stellaceae bacterium]|nr:TonB-dependent receptor [Stellaceae bacterium]